MKNLTFNSKRHLPIWLTRLLWGCLFLMVCSISTSAINYKYLKLEVTGGTSIEIVNLDWMVNTMAYPDFVITAYNDPRAFGHMNSWALYDNNLSWGPNFSAIQSFSVELTNPISPTAIKIQLATWSQAITSFVCYGSNDKSNWSVLLTKTGLTLANFPSYIGTFTMPDTEAPGGPIGLTASAISENSFSLSWNASVDNIAVTGYEIFKNGNLLGTTGNTSYLVTGLASGTTYNMTVKARDAAGNVSAASTILPVTTNTSSVTLQITGLNPSVYTVSDYISGALAYTDRTYTFTQVPSVLTGKKMIKVANNDKANNASSYISFTVNKPVTIYVAIDKRVTSLPNWYSSWVKTNLTTFINDNNTLGYEFYKKDFQAGTIALGGSNAANYSNLIPVVVETTGETDTQAPSVPGGLAASDITSNSFTFSWVASTDNIAVTSYEVFKGGVLYGSTSTTSMAITGLTCGTDYTLAVRAKDAANNISATSATKVFTTGLCTGVVRVNDMGINIYGPSKDYNPEKPWADAIRSHRQWSKVDNGQVLAALDANYWPVEDAELLVYHGLNTGNNHGTYKLSFTGQADVSTGDATIQNKTYNTSTNTTTADLIISSSANDQLFIKFRNSKRTAASAINTGVTNVKLMRPKTPGSTVSYPANQYFTDQFLNALAPFSTIRFMDWTSTNGCGDSLWSDRTLMHHATQQPPKLPNRTYAWQGRGSAWESVILICNAVNKDAFICVPHKATQDYITKLAQLFKYGSDGVNPYTSPQSNPVYPPLNANLKLYVEYSNEVWNYQEAFKQTPWVENQSRTYGHPINFDGSTDVGQLMFRLKAHKSVQVSNTFRSIFGNSEMMTRVRPVIHWQQAYNDLTNRTLSFIDRYYNKRDSRSDVTTPHPVSYYFYGGGGSTYWSCEDASGLTTENIWDRGGFNPANWFENLKKDAGYCKSFGLNYIAYEGNTHPNYNGDLEIVKQVCTDPRMKEEVKEHQRVFNQVDGVLNCFFNLGMKSGGEFGLLIDDMTNFNRPKYQAILELKNEVPEAVNLGNVPPFTLNGNNFLSEGTGWKSPGTGFKDLTANASEYWATYPFHLNADGAVNVRIEYSTSQSSTLLVELNGEVKATYNLNSSGGSTMFTAYLNLSCAGNKLYGLRLICTSGKVTIRNIYFDNGLKLGSVEPNEEMSTMLESECTLYPNPVTQNGNVSLMVGNNQTGIVTLIDLEGRVYFTNTVELPITQMNLSDIPKGIYFLRFISEQTIKTFKLVVK